MGQFTGIRWASLLALATEILLSLGIFTKGTIKLFSYFWKWVQMSMQILIREAMGEGKSLQWIWQTLLLRNIIWKTHMKTCLYVRQLFGGKNYEMWKAEKQMRDKGLPVIA